MWYRGLFFILYFLYSVELVRPIVMRILAAGKTAVTNMEEEIIYGEIRLFLR